MNILGKIVSVFQDRPAPRAGRIDQVTGEDRPEHWDEVAVGKVEALRQSVTGSRTTVAILTMALGILAPKIKGELSPSDIDGALTIIGNALSGVAAIRALWTNAQRRWEPNGRDVIKPGFTNAEAPQAKKRYLGGVLEQKRDYSKRNPEELISAADAVKEAEAFKILVPPKVNAAEGFNAAWLGIITRRAEEIGVPPDELIFKASEHRANGGTLATLAAALPHSYAELSE